jgi:dipeptidyl aminopeptidase/acylaminoacyl peptidase
LGSATFRRLFTRLASEIFMKLMLLGVGLLPALSLAAESAAPVPFSADHLVSMERVSDVQMTSDGSAIVYQLRQTDLAANKGVTSIWRVDPRERAPQPVRLTTVPASAPRLSADGKTVYFMGTADDSAQIFKLPIGGGEPVQVSALKLDVNGFALAPDGKTIAVALEVYPNCATIQCSRDQQDADAKAPSSGQVYDRLFIRHWDTWADAKRSAIYVGALNGDGRLEGELAKVSGALDGDAPSKPFGGMEEMAFSPDSKRVVFALRVAGNSESWSTNFDLFEAPADASQPPKNLTGANLAWDTKPLYTPDGKSLVYLAMKRPGFEADRFHIQVRDLASGATREVAAAWDRSPDAIALSPDGRTLYANANDLGHNPLFAIDLKSGKTRNLSGQGNVSSFAVGARRLAFVRDDLASPAQVYTVDPNGLNLRQATRHNAETLANLRFGAYEQFSFKGWNDHTVYGYAVKPALFKAGDKAPVAFIVHGGPQGSMGNSFHYRWNPQTYAGRGYGVVFIDFHGSTGYGQAFTDSISQDWGGKPLEDLQKGLAAALKKYDWLDGEQVCALGASYGGYMINWIAGNWADRFKCLVNHDGVFDTRAMYYSTEELWFTEWEFGGPEFSNPELHNKFNPVNHVNAWQTPMLVIQGEKDFRVPVTQAIATFTALQRRGIASRYLHFPDENHWVLKPHNSLKWHATVEDWLARYLK